MIPSKKFLCCDFSLLFLRQKDMIIDDPLLIQVYSTVLAGILIFFTIQRHFEYTEEFERASSRLLKQRENAIE